ncbi:MAG: 4'-phosphopantetheinyl transferase superfamily protein [Myxococcaceae bacterium]
MPSRAPSEWLEVLDAGERERHARFKFEADRQAFLAAHGLLRHALSRHVTSVAPMDWRFTTREHGKPFTTDAPGVHFNLSHCRELVVVAIGPRELGVDVEPIDPRHATDDVARRVYGPGELPHSKGDAFFTRWALKEAWVKATGIGLHDDLPSFELEISDDGTAKVVRGDAAQWRFRWWARAGVRLAVCVDSAEPLEIELKDWE